jgi:acetyl esterase/lipase
VTEYVPAMPKVPIADDPRLDPRAKAVLAMMGEFPPQPDVASREELLAEANTPEAIERRATFTAILEMADNEDIAPSKGLTVTEHQVTSQPDGNVINVRFIRPDGGERLPCVYYIHGGGMQIMSCYDGNYRAWGRMIAARGVAVAMVDFRNALVPSSVEEVAPFPAGLNDCVSGVRWVAAEADRLGIDAGRVVIAGESGGGNLAIATALRLKRDGDLGLVAGLYALCPYIAGRWPLPEHPSSSENNGILIDVHGNRGAMAYGIEELERGNPLAWPGFATEDDVRGLVPTVISVNECDPLRDEGIAFYRLLLRAGVPAVCRQMMGTAHGTEILPFMCPDVSRDTAASIAEFARTVDTTRGSEYGG